MGGVGIFLSTVAVWVLAVYLVDWKVLGTPYLPFMICSAGLFLLGLADDIFNMDPQHKLAAQFVIVSILMIFGFRLDWTFSKTANRSTANCSTSDALRHAVRADRAGTTRRLPCSAIACLCDDHSTSPAIHPRRAASGH